MEVVNPTQDYNPHVGMAGVLAPIPWVGIANNVAGTANVLHLVRFVWDRDAPATRMGFQVTTAAAVNDNVDVAIYDITLANRLGSSGATAGLVNATGAKSLAFTAPIALAKGVAYFAGLNYGAAGGAVASFCGTPTPTSVANILGTAIPNRFFGTVVGGATAPAGPLGAITLNPAIILGVRSD